MPAAEIIQNEIFQMEYRFTGSLLDEQYDNHSASLLALILGGINIEKQTENNREVKIAAISISELDIQCSEAKQKKQQCSMDQETRFPLKEIRFD